MLQSSKGTLLNKLILTAYLLISICFIYKIFETAPLMWDDYQFHYIIKPLESGYFYETGKKWETYDDFYYSFIHIKDWQNNRIPNYIFFLLAYYANMSVCTVLNVFAAAGGWILLTKFSRGKVTIASLNCVLLAALVLLAVPDRVLFWRVSCVNYAWGCLLLMTLLLEIKKPRGDYKLWRICSYSLLCGAWHEGLSLPVIVALSAYIFIQYCRKQDLDFKKYIYADIFFILGFIWLLLSPKFQQGRLSTASTSLLGGDYVYWISSVYRMLEYALPATLVYLLTVWKDRKHLWNNFLFYLTTANLLPTMFVFARGGSWGGGSFFYTVSVLIYATHTFFPLFISKRNIALKIASSAAVFTVLFFSFKNVQEVRSYFDSLMNQETNEPVRRCDYYKDGEIPWILKAPFFAHAKPISYAACYYDKPRFYVVFNQKLKDDSVYAAFNDDSEDVTAWKKTPEFSIIRLAKGLRHCYDHPLKCASDQMSNDSTSIRLISSFSADWLSCMVPFVMGKKYELSYNSYYQGYYYIVLPAIANDMDTIKITVCNSKNDREVITIHPAN